MSLSRFDELRATCAVEFERIDLLLVPHAELLAQWSTDTPNFPALCGFGKNIHDFYNSVERIFEGCLAAFGQSAAQSGSYHKTTLSSVATATAEGPAIIGPELHLILNDCLGFRHTFRKAYGIELDWVRMRPLAFELHEYAARVRDEISTFLETLP